MAAGLVGRDENGRRVLVALAIAFVPAAIVGVALESAIKNHLFGVGPVIAAWIVGGVAILVRGPLLPTAAAPARCRSRTSRCAPPSSSASRRCSRCGRGRAAASSRSSPRSRSGSRCRPRSEFSFLLGLATLTRGHRVRGAEARQRAHRHVRLGEPAHRLRRRIRLRGRRGALARRLPEQHGLELFGWYRLVVAAIALVLVASPASLWIPEFAAFRCGLRPTRSLTSP